MARIANIHAELQSVAAGIEFTSVATGGTGGILAVNTATKRTGAASIRVHSAPDDSNFLEIIPLTGNAVLFCRMYFRFVSFSTDDNCAIIQVVGSGGQVQAVIAVTPAGRVRLYDGDIAGTQRGSDSSVLSLNTWYGIELKVQNGGTPEIEARIWEDGVGTPTVFASGAMTTTNNGNTIDFGAIDFCTGLEFFMDDGGVNDNTGSDQNSYPGEGKIILSRPTGAGDAAADSGLFSAVDEITPNGATDFINLDNLGSKADYAMEDTATIGIGSGDTIKFVYAGSNLREEVSAATQWRNYIKNAPAGSQVSGSFADGGNTTFRTNPSSTAAFRNRLVAYTNPATGVAWTPSEIDTMLLGVESNTANNIDVTTMWAEIEYVPAAVGGTSIKNVNGLAKASVKNVNALAIASIKNINGLT